MSYLTLIPAHELIAPKCRTRVSQVFSTPEFRHRAVMSLFADNLGSQPRRDNNILFRLETLSGQAPSFLIQSDIPPDPDKCPPGAKVKEIPAANFSSGSFVVFRLSVNPLIRKNQGKGILVRFDEDDPAGTAMTEWLSKKLAGAFSELEIVNHKREFLKSKDSQKTIVVDLVDGVGKIADPNQLSEFLRVGVGRAKAYGCGLLTVKRI